MPTRSDQTNAKAVEIFEVEIPKLHPTQFRVGHLEAEARRDAFVDMGAEQLEAYLKAHPCPVVVGPDGTHYITDEQHRATASTASEHHHALRSLERHGRPTMFAVVKDSYPDYLKKAQASGATPQAFEAWMLANNYTFLDDRGKATPFQALPARITDMKNDAYRSLSGFLERKAYQLSPGTYFAQFKVAEWLRQKLELSDKAVDRLLKTEKTRHRTRREKFLKQVGRLLASPEAAQEPWYQGPAYTDQPASDLIKKIKRMAE